MKRSTTRILTTHTGSLPRPEELTRLMYAVVERQPVDRAVLAARVREAVREAVQKQAEAGIDIVSDGEMSKPGFANYVAERLTGFGGEPRPFRARDLADFPEVRQQFASEGQAHIITPGCNGPISYRGEPAVQTDIANLKAALQGVPVEEAFIPAASPGCVVQITHNTYYPSRKEYLYALADALKHEYKAITNAGFLLQVDCPDLAMGRHVEFPDASSEEYRRNVALHVEALNHALADIPPERTRVHVCWGNYVGPHHWDVPLRELIDLLLQVRAQALSIEAANPRHAHEWEVFETVKLPDDKLLLPGVIDTKTNYIEHPELVAQRIVRFARLVGRENVIASTDCGFGTFVGFSAVVPRVAYAKLAALAEGARLASQRLWGATAG
ncbi:MAG TPA: cobalamin-independent methionine synthase II family protein [Chloroflexota bacterium]|nr:cobalamin-independent methionine synthase II family protein [Chloroflexota bacterium]